MRRSIFFSALFAAFLLLNACSPRIPEKTEISPEPELKEEPAVQVETIEPVEPTETVEPEPEPEPEPQASVPTPAAPVTPAPRSLTINASRFQFAPNVIRMKANEKVTVKINNTDFEHGITIPALGILEKESVILEGLTPGTYEFRCSAYCGEGHGGMKGTLIVE